MTLELKYKKTSFETLKRVFIENFISSKTVLL